MFADTLDPEDNLFYSISFADDLGASETITTAIWSVESGSASINNESVVDDNSAQAKITLSGSDWYADIKCVATSSDGESYTRRIRLFQESQ